MDLSILIVNWNTRQLLDDCLKSIFEAADGIDFEVIVVDNGSSDGSAEMVANNYPQAVVNASPDNLGFAGANNLAADSAGGDYLLLLNPDTIVPPGAPQGLVKFMKSHGDIGVAGPELTGADGQKQISSFGMFPSVPEALVHSLHLWKLMPKSRLAWKFLVGPSVGENWCETEHLLGACMIIRREVWKLLGGMDPGFFLFLEETDFCLRARQSGWKCAYVSNISITHIGEQSFGKVMDKSGGLYIRSYRRFCRKHGLGLFERLAINGLLVMGALAQAGLMIIKKRDFSKAASAVRSIWYGYLMNPRIQGG